ncbi:hypothetical protein F0919_16830 [Taibaiella lutea]|uniref:Uncharacterized protein n=1 Tax=Taibaiella lutea TaxID=2608001 RepID=A0A5M6CBT5_9BACT|nr:hypothetical protein [Taibaiella lutea]KAA5532453.1 hypothetical protein F0919_16830 [Taibaiella lutea]
MQLKFLCIIIFTAFFAVQNTSGQKNDVIILPDIYLPRDTTEKNELLTSLQSFLLQVPKANKDNAFVSATDLLETSALLDEMKDIEMNEALKEEHFYKPYLNNVVAMTDTDFIIQLSYIGIKDNNADLRASFTLLAKKRAGKFYFSSPLKQNTISWKQVKLGNATVFYKNTLNTANAEKYFNTIATYDRKLQAPKKPLEFYCADNFHEVLQLLGIDYKSDYNGFRRNTISATENNTSISINGMLTSDFTNFDPHDLWHDRLHHVVSTDSINRPVDEGTAYWYGGGSWGLTWAEITTRFKTFIASNPNADWLKLYNESVVFNKEKNAPLNVDYMINALFVRKIEKEKGFDAVITLLSCGKKEKDNENYFEALKKITGIDKEHFNEAVWKLIKEI